MTQEEKDLLLKDISSRLPYGVSVNYKGEIYSVLGITFERLVLCKPFKSQTLEYCPLVEEVKPYIIPLSSMTEEQWMDAPYVNLNEFTFDSFKCGCSTLAFETYEVNLNYVVEFINWCYKNHFDINGLIPMGLAIDATNLKIY